MVNRDTENTARTLVADGKGHLIIFSRPSPQIHRLNVRRRSWEP